MGSSCRGDAYGDNAHPIGNRCSPDETRPEFGTTSRKIRCFDEDSSLFLHALLDSLMIVADEEILSNIRNCSAETNQVRCSSKNAKLSCYPAGCSISFQSSNFISTTAFVNKHLAAIRQIPSPISVNCLGTAQNTRPITQRAGASCRPQAVLRSVRRAPPASVSLTGRAASVPPSLVFPRPRTPWSVPAVWSVRLASQ